MKKKMKLVIKSKDGKREKGVWCMTGKNYFRMLVMSGIVILAAGISVYATEIDGQIESAAKNSYIFRNYLRNESVHVKSVDGDVSLTGKVDEEHDKTMAEDAVENLPGVHSVSNQLEVIMPPPSANSDAWIGAKIKTMLLFHRNVSGTKTQVAVKDGVVTLSGEAESGVQRDLTDQYAHDIEGVKQVINDIKIVEPEKKEDRTLNEKIDDASITAQIKGALLVHRSTSVLKTKVSTQDGRVTLEGVARNAAEKDLVTELVRDIKGVREVENHMTTE